MDAQTMERRFAELTGLDRDHAVRALTTVLLLVGTRIDPGEADDLAAQLPDPYSRPLRSEAKAERFSAEEFLRRVIFLVPLSRQQAEQAVAAVFAVLAEAVSGGEFDAVRLALGADYGDLIGFPTGRDLQRS